MPIGSLIFPCLLKKVMELFKLGSGIDIDGVLTFTPDIFAEMLKITGPVEMPEYGLTLNSDNLLAEIQKEIEYGDNREQPKTILVDFEPLFIEKLKQQPNEAWVEIFKILIKAVEEKRILAYFKDSGLQQFALEFDIAGEIKTPEGDFLSVVFSNVKGSKTDFMTDNFYNLDTEIGESKISHELNINRIHNGGDSELRFYNLQNPSYVRVYVPKGTVLEEISGQDIVNFVPLVDYEAEGYRQDPDLALIESTVYHPFDGVDVFEESGKTVFGFWMITDPQSRSKVMLKYSLKNKNSEGYSLYWQKQSGTLGNKNKINASFRLAEGALSTESAGAIGGEAGEAEGLESKDQSGDLRKIGGSYMLDLDLAIDRNIEFRIK